MRQTPPRRTPRALIDPLEPRQLLAADPVSADHPLWVATPGSVTIDGVLDESSWANAFTIVRHQPWRDNATVSVKFQYGANAGTNGLFVAFSVQDTNLWADGRGVGIAQPWEYYTDDAMVLYFDANRSRDEYLQPDDRAFGVNLGNPEDRTLGAGAGLPIKLIAYDKGDGLGNTTGVNPNSVPPTGILWRTVLGGIVNDDSDTDTGWTTEIFIPWTDIGMASAGPSNGQVIGANFQILYDNDGRERNLTDYRDSSEKWTKPVFIDDQLEGVHSSYSGTQTGVHGPINYAELMFLDPAAGSKPAAIAGLAAANVTGYSAALTFNAPVGVSGASPTGHVSAYEIRYSSGAITNEAQWVSATKFANAYVPRLAGLAESLRLIGLTPGTTYHVAVRAIDAAGNLGDLSNSASFTTQTTTVDPSGGKRLVPSPFGRTLVQENGTGFTSVGDHLGLSWYYTRNLYPGDIWNPGGNNFINFNTNPSYEGEAGPYFDELQAKGINTMRVFLEIPNLVFPPVDQRPRGTYWLESRKAGQASQFNTAMRQFMLNVLREADAHNMYLIFSPMETFSWDESFFTEFPWSNVNGGPLDNINNFFQNSQTLGLAKARMDAVIGWVKSDDFKPYRHRLIGWEPLNEWDSYEWTLNSEGDGFPGREPEMRTRAAWVNSLAAYIRQQDPERLVINSSVSPDPRGPVARLLFNSRNFDVLAPHLYTNASEEPLNNPDTDRKWRAANANANLTSYWLTHVETRRPVINGEWGMTRTDWPDGQVYYRPEFTQAEDEAMYRAVIWSGLGSGQFGTGLRIATEELNFPVATNLTQGYILTDAMRDAQRTLSNFVTSGTTALNFANFNFTTLAGRITLNDAMKGKVGVWGVSDSRQGILYALKNGNLAAGSISGGAITLAGLRRNSIMDIEVWSTAAGAAAPLTTISGAFVSDGLLTIDLPTFAEDVAIKFRARPSTGQSQRIVAVDTPTQTVTFFLDQGSQPLARVQSNTGLTGTIQDISSIARFTGRVVDMDPFVFGGEVYLAVTDERSHLWLFKGNPTTGAWTVDDLTASINAPGLTGDLSHYIPSWNTIHLSGLDARGHQVNYFFQPGVTTEWLFADLTDTIGGPVMTGGLTGYVAPWDGLNLAGLNSENEVIVYWWSLQSNGWQTINMTETFSGPKLYGQLDAYVTPWGGLNIAGKTATNELYTYWWAPGLPAWNVTSITGAAGAPLASDAVEVAVSSSTGQISLFSVDAGQTLSVLQWSPAAPVWTYTNLSLTTNGTTVSMPLGAAASGRQLVVSGRASGTSKSLVVFTFDLNSLVWTVSDTARVIDI